MGLQEQHSEAFWIGEFQKGTDHALAHVFQSHHKPLLYFASRLVENDSEAQDIVADCFLKLWQRKSDFESSQSIKAFLYISCRNACFNYLEHLKVKTRAQQTFLSQLEKGEERVLYDIIKAEVLELLAREIEELPEKCRAVFKLIYFEYKRTDEIAELLGLSVKTVRNYKATAVELLKSSMLKKGISESLYTAILIFLKINS